jgi:hypothetical protein
LKATCARLVGALLALSAPSSVVWAQAPLATDDAATTAPQAWHVELFQQHATLPVAALPATTQDTSVVAVAWGLLPRLEVGFDVPWIAIHGGESVSGGGDLDLTAKWRLHLAKDEHSSAFALALAIELPTGDADRGLGSGVTDVDLTLIGERRVARAVVLRGNLALQFAGNTLTGALGSADRGQVLGGGVSLTADLTPRLQLVSEATGYQGRESDATDRELRLAAGLVFARSPRMSLAFTVQHGWFQSPPWVFQLGVVLDQ